MLLHAFWCFFFTSDKKRARFYCGCWDANTQQERLVHKKFDWLKKSLLIKNLQFLSKNFETWSKWPNHEMVKWTKFHWIWVKIVEFLLIANFRASRIFYAPVPRCLNTTQFINDHLKRKNSGNVFYILFDFITKAKFFRGFLNKTSKK